jgi:hypothetical protein
MTALDEENKAPTSPLDEKTVEEAIDEKVQHKSVVSLSGASADPDSETSSLDENTLISDDVKVKAPRKLIEDEKRAKGRIARDVWTTYLSALGGWFWCRSKVERADGRDVVYRWHRRHGADACGRERVAAILDERR